eukprot:CAMPEP_0170464792 /NCGR_PEP_ID=MMETSP0123-20130129/9375_1 /TAXON_ID=182087 /ORGANISM="Favella ehrenbergii, Strain Fehren 1" /LENGTH=53 /DNA_ID=CAMNT_0010730521 /DNA_START=84 /DNA_END=245 /DNA_ORIENTATION=+
MIHDLLRISLGLIQGVEFLKGDHDEATQQTVAKHRDDRPLRVDQVAQKLALTD